MRTPVRISGLILGVVIGLWSAALASAASINVSPASVPVGGTVTVSGDVLAPGGTPGCAVPGTVSLFSAAFGDPNIPVQTTAGADSKFSVQVHLPAGVAPGTYSITGRCGGGNLGVQATLVVTPALPSTGSGGLNTGPAGRLAGSPAVLLLTLATMSLLVAGWLGRRSM
ncbi:MAG: hypothetical protein M3070_10085 [Actinomycetota bacterium]|nr:hypothetical protein [Actinomycetota bacterium]